MKQMALENGHTDPKRGLMDVSYQVVSQNRDMKGFSFGLKLKFFNGVISYIVPTKYLMFVPQTFLLSTQYAARNMRLKMQGGLIWDLDMNFGGEKFDIKFGYFGRLIYSPLENLQIGLERVRVWA